MKIYVASSWRNNFQPEVVHALKVQQFDVYDFRNPPKQTDFSWSMVDEDWHSWSTHDYLAALDDPVSRAGFAAEYEALEWCDVCVLVLPAGRSAHLELGWCAGKGKPTCIFLTEHWEVQPAVERMELMYLLADRIASTYSELFVWCEEQYKEIKKRVTVHINHSQQPSPDVVYVPIDKPMRQGK